MGLADYKDWAIIISGIVGLIGLFLGLIQYAHFNAIKRAEHFLEMRKRFKDNDTFRTIFALLESNPAALSDIPLKDRMHLVGFLEEVALMTNSRMIRRELAHYFFAYFALKIWRTDEFWNGMDRNSHGWALYRDFVERMSVIDRKFRYSRRKFRF